MYCISGEIENLLKETNVAIILEFYFAFFFTFIFNLMQIGSRKFNKAFTLFKKKQIHFNLFNLFCQIKIFFLIWIIFLF